MEDQFATILAAASKQYADSSGQTLSEYQSPSIKSIEELQRHIDQQNEQFSHFRAKRESIFKTIAAALRPVELVGDIAAGAVSNSFPPAQNIFSAAKFLISAAHNVSSLYDAIEELFANLKDFTIRLDVYTRYPLSASLKEKLITILAALFEVLVIATQEVRRGRLRAYFKKLVGSEGPVQTALDKLGTLTQAEERLVLAETYGGVTQMNLTADRVEDLVGQVSENLFDMRLDHLGQVDAARRDRLREILGPSPFPEDFYTSFFKSRVSGTGDWLLQDESLQSWIRGEKRFLWMCGSPGTGKSFLTAHLISWAREHLPHVAYFFFRDNNPETKSVVQALRDVAYQISESDKGYAKALIDNLYSNDDIRTVSSAYRRLLAQPLMHKNDASTTYVFLDGIDEADAEEISQLLFQFSPGDDEDQDEDCTMLRFALIGRSYMSDSVSSALDRNGDGEMLTTIQLTPERSEGDVSAYIARGVSQSRILNQTTPEFRDEILKLMKNQVDGLFILAKFMLAEVNRRRHPRSILKSLHSYPKEINGMLERTVESLSSTITEEEAEDLNEMLRWIACAEEALSLEQLEAILVLRFGDPPFRLEETLRGQYGCFFELEREDGMTTDDLIKDFERRQRDKRRDSSPIARISPSGRLSLVEEAISDRAHSPLRNELSSHPSSVSTISPKPRRGSRAPSSPTRNFDFLNSSRDTEFRSKKSTTFVSFFHTTVRQFFLTMPTPTPQSQPPKVHFDIVASRLHIVKTCLSIFTDKAWFEAHVVGESRRAIKQYAAWYWQEHLACLTPSLVGPDDKRDLVSKLYRMLNEEDVIFDWTVMYKKHNEGLEVLMERNIRNVMNWFQDPAVISTLPATIQSFAASLDSKPYKVCERIGRLYAKEWLSPNFKTYFPTVFCFDIVQSVALMEAGYTWSQSHAHWLEVPLDDRISQAADWTKTEKTGFYYRRLGSTYLLLGHHERALSLYKQALSVDNNRLQCLGRIAFCLSKAGRYGEALEPALECAAMEEKSMAEGEFKSDALQRSRWRLYKDYFLIAQCYYRNFRIEEALLYYNKAVKASAGVELNPFELFEAQISYLEVLSSENLQYEMMRLLQEMSLQVTDRTRGQNRLVEMILSQYNRRLVLESIPKAASKTGRTDFILEALEHSIAVAHDMRDPVVVLYLRLAYGTTCAYSFKFDEAILTFEQISLIEYRPKGNISTRQAYAISFQRLAHLYKQEAIDAGLGTMKATDWIERLEVIQQKHNEHQRTDWPASIRGSDANVASVFLGLFYRLLGRKDDADAMLGTLVRECLELLYDSEPLNDEYALENLLWVLLAANDVNTAAALAQSMRKINPNASLTTQSDSPVYERLEPKLPNILSSDRSCAQCLDNISSSDEFAICKLCLDCYCMNCMQTVIQQPGNTTRDRQAGVRCRSDHEWLTVPPLNKSLHTGQILYPDGQLQEFAPLADELKSHWAEVSK